MLRGDVGLLADLGVEVVKTQAGRGLGGVLTQAIGLRREREFPASLADGLQVVAGEIIMRFARGLLRLTEEDRRDVTSVDHRRRGHGAASEGDESRQEVDGRGDGVIDGSRGHAARPPGESRHAHAAFPGRTLATAERPGAAAVGALDEPRAVVRSEDHECVLIEPLRTQGIEHLADAPVDFLDPIAEATVLGFAGERGARPDRGVDGVVGKVEVEGLILAAGDEVDGLLGIELDQAALPLPIHQFRDLLIPEDRHDRDLGLGALLEHVVRIGDAVIMVETLPGGQKFGLVAQVPLSDHLGGIAFFLKSFGYSYFRRIKSHGLTRKIDPWDGDAGAVAAGHHLGPGNRADRGGVEAGQFHALLGHPVQVGGALLGRPERSDVPIAHIVDEDHHHVGRASGGGGRKPGGQQDEKRLHGVPL